MVIIVQGRPCKGPFACRLRRAALSLCLPLTRVGQRQSQKMFARGLAHGVVNIFACICPGVTGHCSAWWSCSQFQASGTALPAAWLAQTHNLPMAIWQPGRQDLAAAIRSCAMKPVYVGNLSPSWARQAMFLTIRASLLGT